MSSFEDLTTRAAVSVAACVGMAVVPARQRNTRLPKKDIRLVMRFIVFLLRWICFVITTLRRAETRATDRRKRNDPRRSAYQERGAENKNKPGQSKVERRYD